MVSLVPDAQPFTSMLGVDLVGSMLYPNRVIATHYYAQLRIPDKGRSIKDLVVCYVVWLGSMIYGMGLWTSARCVAWSLVVVRMAIELKYRNTP